jgi:hypothetical protein
LTFFDYCMSIALEVVAQSTLTTISRGRWTATSGLASSMSHWLYSLDGVAEVAISAQRITEVWR